MSETTAVECGECGVSRPSELTSAGAERPPCPECGSTQLRFTVSVTETVPRVVDSVSWEMTPGDQNLGWERRWSLIKAKLLEVTATQKSPGSADNIHQAAAELRSFFVLAYHLKDALKNEASQTQVPGANVENAITNSPVLSLLADLANLDKHGQLSKPPRSGTVPLISKISAASADDGWSIKFEIQHGSSAIDGTSFAKKAVQAWEAELKQWSLI